MIQSGQQMLAKLQINLDNSSSSTSRKSEVVYSNHDNIPDQTVIKSKDGHNFQSMTTKFNKSNSHTEYNKLSVSFQDIADDFHTEPLRKIFSNPQSGVTNM